MSKRLMEQFGSQVAESDVLTFMGLLHDLFYTRRHWSTPVLGSSRLVSGCMALLVDGLGRGAVRVWTSKMKMPGEYGVDARRGDSEEEQFAISVARSRRAADLQQQTLAAYEYLRSAEGPNDIDFGAYPKFFVSAGRKAVAGAGNAHPESVLRFMTQNGLRQFAMVDRTSSEDECRPFSMSEVMKERPLLATVLELSEEAAENMRRFIAWHDDELQSEADELLMAMQQRRRG